MDTRALIVLPVLLAPAAIAQNMVPLAGSPVSFADNALTPLVISDDSALMVRTSRPGPFQLQLELFPAGTAQVTGPLQPMTMIDASSPFQTGVQPIYCYPPNLPQYCPTPHFLTQNQYAYFGFRFEDIVGTHYGWMRMEARDLGFGRLEIEIVGGAYDSRAGVGVPAGIMDEGPVCPDTCGTSDFNGDGDAGTDQDIEAFFACLGGSCCETCWCWGADFNVDGDAGTDQDIESFFRVLGGNPC
ncbi:MAG TPA: hypothetical protein VD997_02260 [Phycisphaerales bacterium]|nr:hypothetical protein [Phycisphaerales bacterium]